jgi:hypothetical protein
VRGLTGHPIRVTSGYRNFQTNQLVGGSKNSAHLFGLAADIQCPAFGSALDLCQQIEDSDIQYDQLIHEYKSWCHISIAGQPRRMSLTKDHGKKYELGLL